MTEETREHAHELIDQLPEAQLTGLVQFLETIVGTLSYPLANAPLDDEPLTEEDRRAVAEAVEWLRHNEPIPHNQLLSEFGLTIADWERWPRSRYGEKYPGAMAKRIIRTDQAKADVRAIEHKTALQILKTLGRFAKTEEGNIRQLAGIEPPQFRLRTQDRIFFQVREDALEILRVRNRREAYR